MEFSGVLDRDEVHYRRLPEFFEKYFSRTIFCFQALVNSALSETEETERLHNVIMSTARDKEYMGRILFRT